MNLARTIADLNLVMEYWPAVADLRDPASHAPRPSAVINLMQRAELDYQARQERAERDVDAPGGHKDAARAEVLDLLAQITADADEACDTIAAHIHDGWRPDPPTTAFADPRTMLGWAAAQLHRVDDHDLRHVAAIASRMAAEVSRALYLAPDGQTLKTHCPWCKGGLSGAYSLRVRLLPGHLVAIVCESDIPCEPPSRKVGTWLRGRPAWPFSDWRWLANELHRADRKTAA